MFEQHVIADRVDERSQALRAKNLFIPKRDKETREGFLAQIFDRFRRPEPGPQLDFDQGAEIGGEMFLRAIVSRP